MINPKLKFLIILLFLAFITSQESGVGRYELFAQDDLAQLKENYFKENRYSEFIDYINAHKKGNPPAEVSYYIAVSRYEQLRYLERTQRWEEYFNRGEDYRQELIREALNTIKLTSRGEGTLFIYAKCLLWQFYKDMQDEQEQTALTDLLSAVRQYSDSAKVDLSPIKYVADKLSSYGDRLNSGRVYKLYLESLTASLQTDKETRLISLARQLADRRSDTSNPFFAEEVFKKVEELNPDLILDEQTQYLRAYNLENIKQYKDTYLQYQILVENYPQTAYSAQVIFKMGVISVYILQDIFAGQGYFTELIQSSSLKPHIFASFYQLGLIAQYQGDISKAREYYNALLEKTEEISCCGDLIDQAKARLKEIEENRLLEFNLKAFMEASLKGDKGIVYEPNVDIEAQMPELIPNQDVRLSASALLAASGCMSVNFEYIWSGGLGSAEPGNDQDNFITHYIYPGTKLVQLTVITPSGILGRDLLFLDVIDSNEGRQ